MTLQGGLIFIAPGKTKKAILFESSTHTVFVGIQKRNFCLIVFFFPWTHVGPAHMSLILVARQAWVLRQRPVPSPHHQFYGALTNFWDLCPSASVPSQCFLLVFGPGGIGFQRFAPGGVIDNLILVGVSTENTFDLSELLGRSPSPALGARP